MAKKTKPKRPAQAPQTSVKRETSARSPSFARLDAILEEKSAWVLLGVLLLVEALVFKDFLLLRNVYLYKDIGSDSINSQYPLLFHTVDYLKSEGIPKWSFNQGMGQNIFGLMTFDPFLLVFYLAGTGGVAYAIVFVEVLKGVLGATFFFLFLRSLDVSGFSAIVGGLLYAFTGYMILGGQWYIFSYDAMCVGLLLYGAERFLKNGSWYLLPIPFALIASYQPFYVYLYGILLLVYATVRSLEAKPWDVRHAAISVLKLVPFSVLGVGLSSVFLFSNVAQILESPRVGGESSYFQILSSQPVFHLASPIEYISDALRLFSSDLLGTGNSFSGWMNYLESPLLYAGLLNLLLVPQLFAHVDRNRRILYGGLLGVCMIPLLFPYFRHAFWLFSGDYFRALTFFIDLVLLYLGVRGLSAVLREGNVSWIALVASVVVALLVLYAPPAYERYARVDVALRSAITLFLFAEALLIFALRLPDYRPLVKAALLVTVACEAAYLSSVTVNRRDILSAADVESRTGYNDYTKEAVAFLDSIDAGFYRVDKDYASGPAMHASLNDAKIQRYRGITSYHPFNQKYYIEFLQGLGVIQGTAEVQTRWVTGLGDRLPLEAVTGVRYSLTKRPDENAFGPTYDRLADVNDVHVYRNRQALPLGIVYDSYIPASAFATLANGQKDEAIVKAVVVQDADLGQVQVLSQLEAGRLHDSYMLSDFEQDVAARRQDTLSVSEQSQNHIAGTIQLEQERLLFFAIPYDRGWSATVDGESAPLLLANLGFMGLMLPAGSHEVTLDYQPPYLAAGAGVSLVSLLAFGLLAVRSRQRKGTEEAS